MNTIDLLKRRIDTYQNLIDRLDRMTSGNYMHTAASIRCTLNAMISNNQALLDDVTNFSADQDETGDLELNEFENAILEILDFTSRSVLANNKMPKFRRLQQLSKEWSVNLLNVAKKVIEDEEEKPKMVDAFLQAMRESDFYIKFIYTEGGCFQLYKILKVLFPDAEPYMLGHGTHVATMIGGKLWDINGEMKDSEGDFCKMTEAQMQDAEKWSFAANNDLYFGECPICGHPITIDRAKLINKGLIMEDKPKVNGPTLDKIVIDEMVEMPLHGLDHLRDNINISLDKMSAEAVSKGLLMLEKKLESDIHFSDLPPKYMQDMLEAVRRTRSYIKPRLG